MKKVKVVLHSTLKRYSPQGTKEATLKIKEPENVKDIIKKLEIIEGEVELILVNSKISNEDTVLKNNDVVELYPVFGGG
jgi:sulfur carrier protein ThiS